MIDILTKESHAQCLDGTDSDVALHWGLSCGHGRVPSARRVPLCLYYGICGALHASEPHLANYSKLSSDRSITVLIIIPLCLSAIHSLCASVKFSDRWSSLGHVLLFLGVRFCIALRSEFLPQNDRSPRVYHDKFLPASTSIPLTLPDAMATTPLSPARRKQILRVIFISLLLDLVSEAANRRREPADSARFPSPSSCRCSPNFSSFTATTNQVKAHRTPFSVVSSVASMPTSNHFHVPSAIAMTLSFWVEPWVPCSPSYKQSRLRSLAPCPTSTGEGRRCCGRWRAISRRWPCGWPRRTSALSLRVGWSEG